MADVIYKRGLAEKLDSVIAQDGQILVTTDTGEMYIDMSDDIKDRKKISDNQALMKIITDMAGNNTIDYSQTNSPVYSGLYRVEGYSYSEVHMSIVEYENSSDRVSGIIDPSMIYFTTGTSLETGEYLYIKCLNGTIQQVIRYSDLGLPPYITIGWDGDKASISSGVGNLMLSGRGNGSSIYLTENTIHNNAETTIFNINNKRTLTLQEGGIQLGDDFTQKQLIGVAYPETETSAANKKYVDDTILEVSREIVQTALSSVDFSQTTGPWRTGTYIVKDVIDNTVYFDLTPGYTQTFTVINENKNFKIGDKIVIIVNNVGAAEKIVTVKELTDKMDKSEMIKIDESNSSVEIQASSINFSKLESKNVEILYENCSYKGGSGGLKFRTPYTIYSVEAYQPGSVSIYFDANGSSGCNINIVNNPNVQFFPEDIVSFEADNESNGYLGGGQAISIRVHRVGLSPVDVNLTGIANPIDDNDAANKAYVDNKPGVKTAEDGEIFNLYDEEGTTVDLGTIAGVPIGEVELPKNEASFLGHAEGAVTKAQGRASHAEGIDTKAIADASHTEGAGTFTAGLSSHAEGFGINFKVAISGDNGANVTVTPNSTKKADIIRFQKIGKNAIVRCTSGKTYYIKHAEPIIQNNIIIAYRLTLDKEFDGTVSNGFASIYMGAALSYMSHTEGGLSTAININDLDNTNHIHSCQHAEGHRTLSLDYAAHSEGAATIASGNSSHAEGNSTEASGEASHSEGLQTLANKRATHAEGFQTKAVADYAHSEGANTTASGWASHAGGYDTVAGYQNQTVIGCYNQNKSGTLFEIGNGDRERGLRRNAFEVYDDGHAELPTQGETDNSVIIKSYLDEKFNALDNTLKDILAIIQSGNLNTQTVSAIEQTIVSYLENKTVAEVEA